MILIAASMHLREHRTFSLRTPSIHIRDEDPKDVVKSSICGIMMGILFMIIFAIIGIVGIFTNLNSAQYIWMLVVITLTYITFIPYFIFILIDLRKIATELEKHQDESMIANPYAFMSGMNTINAITSTEKYNLFRLLNFQFFIISLILSAFIINSKIVIGSLLAIVNYIIASTIIIYSCRKCWLSCCNIKVATKRPKRYHFHRYPCKHYSQHKPQSRFMIVYYILKGATYILFMSVEEEDFKFTQLSSLFYSFIMTTQLCYVLYLIKKINHTYYSKKYYRCYMTLFQSLYLSYTVQNCVLKGLYLFSLLCCYISFFLEKPYHTITNEHLFGIEQFCSYEHFIYLGIFAQLIYYFLFRSYCVNKEDEQIQIFDMKQQLQPHECRLQWLQQQDYPFYKNQISSLMYQIADLEALQEIYDNIVLPNSQQDLRINSKGGLTIDLDQWIEDKKFQCQLEGKKMNQQYFNNLKQFIEENIGKHKNTQREKQIQDRQECAICLQNLESKQNITQLECHFSHKFHSECIEKWIEAVHKCPLCNRPA